MTNRRLRPFGFTLVEMMVGLAIGGLVLTLVGRTFAAVSQSAAAIESDRRQRDGAANGQRWLRSSMSSIQAPTDSHPFVGRSTELAFSASTRRASGRFEIETIRVRQEAGSLLAERSVEGRVAVLDGVAGVTFDYLVTPGARSRWMREWVSETTAPLAVRIRVRRVARPTVDTTVLLVRDRR